MYKLHGGHLIADPGSEVLSCSVIEFGLLLPGQHFSTLHPTPGEVRSRKWRVTGLREYKPRHPPTPAHNSARQLRFVLALKQLSTAATAGHFGGNRRRGESGSLDSVPAFR